MRGCALFLAGFIAGVIAQDLLEVSLLYYVLTGDWLP